MLTALLGFPAILSAAACPFPGLNVEQRALAQLIDSDSDCTVSAVELKQSVKEMTIVANATLCQRVPGKATDDPAAFDLNAVPGTEELTLDEASCFIVYNWERHKVSEAGPGELVKWRQDAIDELTLALNLEEPIPYSEVRRGLAHLDAVDLGKKPVKRILSRRFSIGRQLTDDIMSLVSKTKVERPLFVSYVDDRLRKEKLVADPEAKINDGLRLLGDIKYAFPSIENAAIIVGADVDTGKDAAESQVKVTYKQGWIIVPSGKERAFSPSLSASYETDRDGRRDIYAVGSTVSGRSKALWSMGYDVPDGAFDRLSFLWLPEITLMARKVDDAGGNAKLQEAEGRGTAIQLTPKVSFSFLPDRIEGKSRVFGSYTHLWDFDLDVDHGLWEAGYAYKLSEVLSIQLIYRRGRNLSTTEKIDELLFGIGIDQ